MKKLLIKSFVRLTLSYVYAFVGGCIFYAIERKPETQEEIYSRLSRKLRQDFTAQFNISINESDFNCFMHKAFEVVTVGNKMDWSILSGLSFTMTSLTTIGRWFEFWTLVFFCFFFNSNALKILYTMQRIRILEKELFASSNILSLNCINIAK